MIVKKKKKILMEVSWTIEQFIFIEHLEILFLKHHQLPKICSKNIFLSFSLSYENIF